MASYNDLFKIKHNNMLPEKGKILISEPFLQDMYFQRSVILLIEHHEKGSMGFVLNKKTEIWLNALMEGLEDTPFIPLFLGGPVSPDRLFFIHSLGDMLPGSIQVDDNLYVDGDFECLKSYLLSGKPVAEKIKFFLGYSGWSQKQLTKEIKSDSWLVSTTNVRNIFRAEGEDFWKNSVEAMGGSYKNWANYPKDPLLN